LRASAHKLPLFPQREYNACLLRCAPFQAIHIMNDNFDFHGVTIYAVLFAAALLIHIFLRRRKTRVALAHQQKIADAGLTEPASLHPAIDPARCLGSGGCVHACPEGAIDLINGKAQLINPAACIGHGACAAACPHHAITLVFGTEKCGMDIPVLNANFETSIPGIFIAGELGGMGLIRKAAEQGSQAIDAIARLKNNGQPYDVVIVGAGPAGLSAGLAAMQKKLRFVVLEQETSLGGAIFHYPRNKIAMTAPLRLPIIGPVEMRKTSKEKLLDFWAGVLQKTGLQINLGERMETVEPADGGFLVKTGRQTYVTRAVLLAIGRRGTPRKLSVAGESLPKVTYSLVDAMQYRSQRVLVVGGGDSALEAAISLADEADTTVTLSYRGNAFNRVKTANREQLQTLQARGRVDVLLESEVRAITADSVTLEQAGRTLDIANDAVILCTGGVLPTPFLQQLGIRVETKFGQA
jgi:thioredoxin reductase